MNARSKYFFYFKINLGKTKFLFNMIETYILSVKSFRSYSLIFFPMKPIIFTIIQRTIKIVILPVPLVPFGGSREELIGVAKMGVLWND